MERFTFKAQKQRLTVGNLEEYIQIVLHDLLGVVQNSTVHLFTWLQSSRLLLNNKDFLGEDMLFEGLLRSGFTWVGPTFHLNL